MSNRRLHDWRQARVTDVVAVTNTIRRIVLDVPDVSAPAPGSHLDILVPVPQGDVVRSYSVIDDGRYPDRISLGVRLDAQGRGGSAFMHSLTVGQHVTVSQPVQTFELTWGRPSYVLLAGGIGITPVIGMARRLQRWGAEYRVIYTARSRADLAFADDLVADHPGRVRLVCSDEEGQVDLAEVVAGTERAGELYVCGPMPMLHAASRAWDADGRPPERLRFETFGSSGTAPAAPFTVRVPRLGVETHVPADVSPLEALSAVGVEVMSDCLRGECGLCLVDILDSEQEIDHRDVFLSDRQRAVGNQLCLCVSRALGGTLTLDVP